MVSNSGYKPQNLFLVFHKLTHKIQKTYKTGWLCSDSCITKITHDIYLGTKILMLMLNIIKYLLVFPCEIY